MKTLVIIMLAITSSVCYGQTTTVEEYNWMINGYKDMIKKGQDVPDVKKGYSFVASREYSESRGDYLFTFRFLQRDKDKTLAGIVVTMTIISTGKVNYYGIPLGGWLGGKYYASEFMPKFEAEIKPLGWGSYYALTGTLTNLFASLAIPKE